MSDVEYLLECAKQCHEVKDAADILDIAQDVEQLDNIYQQGNPNAVIHFIQKVIAKHQRPLRGGLYRAGPLQQGVLFLGCG